MKRKQETSSKRKKKKVASTPTKLHLEPPFHLHRHASDDRKNKTHKKTFAEGFQSVVDLLKGKKNIVILAGAGISVACGIPDFRSKGSGLYSTLDIEELGLSCAEELFDYEVFQEDPRPFYKFAKNLYFPLGTGERVRPSDSHKLLSLLEEKKKLLRIYTQNIDGLEEVAGVSSKRVIYAHGSLQYATCCKCKKKVKTFKEQSFEEAILKQMVPTCQVAKNGKSSSSVLSTSIRVKAGKVGSASKCNPSSNPKKIEESYSSRSTGRKRPLRSSLHSSSSLEDDVAKELPVSDHRYCGGVLKPGVTFFGETLNNNVVKSLESDRNKVDALIVIGTSLSVAPMSKVIGYLPKNIPRILINRAIVHPKTTSAVGDDDDDDEEDFEFRDGYVFDAYLLGFCDDVTRALAKELFSAPAALQLPDNGGRRKKRKQKKNEHNGMERGTLLSAVIDGDDEDDVFDAKDWDCCDVPPERIFLFPGAQPPDYSLYGSNGDDDSSKRSYREIANCDGCSQQIIGTIQKCIQCFDYDLCSKCFPKLSKTHFNGEHDFCSELAQS